MVANTTNESATLTLTGTDSHEESTSIGASLTWSTELNLFGLVNQKVSATLSGGDQWSITDKTINSESVGIPRGDLGCLFDSASLATVTPWPASHRPAHLCSGSPAVIDAAKDPKDAADAMSHWDDPTATNKVFALTSNPFYSNTPTISGVSYCISKNSVNPESHLFGLSTTIPLSGWSIGGSFSAETKLGLIGFANASLAVTVTASHEWATEHDENQTGTAIVDPGYTDWIQMYTRQVTITGDYSFSANGTDYQVNNVTITEPDNAPPDQPQGPYTATVFTVVGQTGPCQGTTGFRHLLSSGGVRSAERIKPSISRSCQTPPERLRSCGAVSTREQSPRCPLHALSRPVDPSLRTVPTPRSVTGTGSLPTVAPPHPGQPRVTRLRTTISEHRSSTPMSAYGRSSRTRARTEASPESRRS